MEDLARGSLQELANFLERAAVGLHWVGPDGTILALVAFHMAPLEAPVSRRASPTTADARTSR